MPTTQIVLFEMRFLYHQGQLNDWMFGCDICQDICPWNRLSNPHNELLFNPHPELLSITKKDWEEITKEMVKKVFKKSAVKRTKFEGLQRDIEFLRTRLL